MLQGPMESRRPEQDELPTVASATVPNQQFDGHRRIRGKTKKLIMPWETNMSSFQSHSAKSSQGISRQATMYLHQGLVTPQTPSISFNDNEDALDGRSDGSLSLQPEAPYDQPLLPSLGLFSMPPTPEAIKFSSHPGNDALLVGTGCSSAVQHPLGPCYQVSAVPQNAGPAPGIILDPLLSPIALSIDTAPFGGSSFNNKENYWYKIPPACGKPQSMTEIAKNVLNTLHEAKLTLLEFLTCLFDNSLDEFVTF